MNVCHIYKLYFWCFIHFFPLFPVDIHGPQRMMPNYFVAPGSKILLLYDIRPVKCQGKEVAAPHDVTKGHNCLHKLYNPT